MLACVRANHARAVGALGGTVGVVLITRERSVLTDTGSRTGRSVAHCPGGIPGRSVAQQNKRAIVQYPHTPGPYPAACTTAQAQVLKKNSTSTNHLEISNTAVLPKIPNQSLIDQSSQIPQSKPPSRGPLRRQRRRKASRGRRLAPLTPKPSPSSSDSRRTPTTAGGKEKSAASKPSKPTSVVRWSTSWIPRARAPWSPPSSSIPSGLPPGRASVGKDAEAEAGLRRSVGSGIRSASLFCTPYHLCPCIFPLHWIFTCIHQNIVQTQLLPCS